MASELEVGKIKAGDGTTTAIAGADDVIIAQSSNDAGVTIRTATSSTGQICFADGNTGNEAYRGFIGYAHGTDKLNLGSGGSTRLTIDSSGDVSVGIGNSKEATIQSTNSGRVEGNPAYSFRGDLDTGMFNPNTDNTLAFATGGTERMRISSTGNVELSSDDPNTNVNRNLNIRDTRAMAADVGGGISLFGKYNTGGSYSTFAQIVAGKTDAVSGNYDGYLAFKTRPTNSLPVERMRISSTGDVTVGQGGTASAHTKLTIDGTSAANRGPRLAFGREGDPKGLIGTESGLAGNDSDDLFIFAETGNAVKIATGGSTTPRLTIASTGLATFSGGIAFSQTNTSATGATATGTTLDHYEEGTWTPSLSPGSGSFTTLTYTIQRGRYIRVGSQVWCGFEITVNSFTIGTGASYVSLDGLPFSRPALEDQYGSGVVTQYSGWTTAAPTLLPRNGAASCILRYGFSATTVTNLSPANITNGCVMHGFVTFSV